MSATASSSLPASRGSVRKSSSRVILYIVACSAALIAVAALPGSTLLLFLAAVGLATLMIAVAALFPTLLEPIPKRLVPVGLAGSLSVKLVGNSILIGRLPCCRVELPLPTVSSHHCRLVRTGARWYIEDLDSRNGTVVNGKRIRKKRLRIGDEISIGEFTFRVE